MKHDLKRLSMDELRDVQRKIRFLKTRRWCRNRLAQTVALAAGLGFLPLAIIRGYVGEWLIISALFTFYFVALSPRAADAEERAHWVRPSKPRDTGPLSP